ncbi:hypothetical protein [Shouchella patagoniensis]|uniref:hypothetical protein n=1 Tax=Shouchella patagoniensis TaxID=228576 RepID=UPI000994CA89|nr:hypothetical protein [Shouchella patagoniensis]
MEIREANETELQLLRMQQQVKDIAREKHKEVIGIEQTAGEEWVIVSKKEEGSTLQFMINDCTSPYRGSWDFALQVEYKDSHHLFIGDIKGEPCRGFGSICMEYLKETAWSNNCKITGDLAKRDWGHLDRLTHFYKKHSFSVFVDETEKAGQVYWTGM